MQKVHLSHCFILASSDFVKSPFTIPIISKQYYRTAWKFHLLALSPVCVKCLSDVRHTHHFMLSESCWGGQTFFSICLVESLWLRWKGCFFKKSQNSNWCSLIKRMLATMRQDKVPSDWSRPERFRKCSHQKACVAHNMFLISPTKPIVSNWNVLSYCSPNPSQV